LILAVDWKVRHSTRSRTMDSYQQVSTSTKDFGGKWKFWKWVVKKNKVETILFGEWEKLWPMGRKGKTWGSIYRDLAKRFVRRFKGNVKNCIMLNHKRLNGESNVSGNLICLLAVFLVLCGNVVERVERWHGSLCFSIHKITGFFFSKSRVVLNLN